MTAKDILKEAIETRLKKSSDTPLLSLPDKLVELKEVSRKETTTINTIIPYAEEDPGFSAYIIHLANSVYYRGHRPTALTIEEACVRIGLLEVGNYAIYYSMKTLHEVENGPKFIINAIRNNWLGCKKVSKIAEENLKKKKDQDGIEYNPSTVRTVTSLYFASQLSVFYMAMELEKSGLQINEQDMDEVIESMRPILIKHIFAYVGYPMNEIKRFVLGEEGEISYIDYIHKSIISKNKKMVHTSVLNRMKKIRLMF